MLQSICRGKIRGVAFDEPRGKTSRYSDERATQPLNFVGRCARHNIICWCQIDACRMMTSIDGGFSRQQGQSRFNILVVVEREATNVPRWPPLMCTPQPLPYMCWCRCRVSVQLIYDGLSHRAAHRHHTIIKVAYPRRRDTEIRAFVDLISIQYVGAWIEADFMPAVSSVSSWWTGDQLDELGLTKIVRNRGHNTSTRIQ